MKKQICKILIVTLLLAATCLPFAACSRVDTTAYRAGQEDEIAKHIDSQLVQEEFSSIYVYGHAITGEQLASSKMFTYAERKQAFATFNESLAANHRYYDVYLGCRPYEFTSVFGETIKTYVSKTVIVPLYQPSEKLVFEDIPGREEQLTVIPGIAPNNVAMLFALAKQDDLPFVEQLHQDMSECKCRIFLTFAPPKGEDGVWTEEFSVRDGDNAYVITRKMVEVFTEFGVVPNFTLSE